MHSDFGCLLDDSRSIPGPNRKKSEFRRNQSEVDGIHRLIFSRSLQNRLGQRDDRS